MTKYILTIVSLFLGLSCYAQDKPYEKVHLKNGTVISGFISSQIPGKTMRINPSWLVAVVPAQDVIVEETKLHDVNSLSKEWKQWINENPSRITYQNGKRYLRLTSLNFQKPSLWSNYHNSVKIIDNSDDYIKYVVPISIDDSRQIEISNDSIIEIERSLREANCLSGIVDSIVVKNNRHYVGQIIRIIPGKTISIQDSKGDVHTVKIADIKSQNRKVLNKNQKWIDQALFLDKVRKDGHDNVGMITEQTYGKSKNSIMMQTIDGGLTSIDIDDIQELGKSRNEAYSPIYKTILNDKEVNVCKKSFIWCKAFDTNNGNKRIVLPMDSLQVINADSCGKAIGVVYNNIEANTDVNLYYAMVLPKVFGKKESGVGLYTASCFDNEVKDISAEKNEQTINLKFPIKKGYYILFRSSDNRAVVFKIE